MSKRGVRCGCQISFGASHVPEIVFCRVHRQAEALLECCRLALSGLKTVERSEVLRAQLEEVIARATA